MKRSTKKKKTINYLSAALIFGGSLLAIFMLALFTPWLSQMERATQDFIFRIRPHIAPSSDLVIAAIDETSQKEIGPLPWNRVVHAALLQKLKEEGARGVVFDVIFDQPKPAEDGIDQDAEFARAIADFPAVILGRDISRTSDPRFALEEILDPLPQFLEAGATAGFVSTLADVDTKIRSASWLVHGKTTLATEALKRFDGMQVRQASDDIFLGNRRVPGNCIGDTPTFLINFAGPAHTIPTRSYYQILDGTIPKGFLKDKVVFVGADLAAENRTGGPAVDRFPTPVDEEVLMPGVEIHANAYNTALSGAFVRVAPPALIWSMLLAFAVLITLYSNLLSPVAAGAATLFTIVVSGVAVYMIFVEYNYWLPSVAPTTLIVFVYGGNTVAQYRIVLRERAQIQSAFRHYVSAEVLGELMKDPESLGLGGREVEATVMFTDIAGFSKISEKITPTQLTEMLNQYFELLAGVIMKEQGMVNKFIGDAVMAIWGAPLDNPGHATMACRASLQMHRAMLVMDPVKCRIGINTGRMIAGNMGSRQRFEYTVIGDAVNLASRLEGVNKPYKTDVMISEMTEEKVRGAFLLREVDVIRVVGKLKPVRIYQLLDEIGNTEAVEYQRWTEMIESFTPAIELYKTRSWKHAVEAFERHGLFFPEDPVGEIYRDRCREFLLQPPPDDWDGVYQMETK